MPQWYQVEISVSGVITLTTTPVTPRERSPCGAPVPARATPTSIITLAGREKWQICQRSHWSRDFRLAAQKGGGAMPYIQRVTVTESPSEMVLMGASTISC